MCICCSFNGFPYIPGVQRKDSKMGKISELNYGFEASDNIKWGDFYDWPSLLPKSSS